MPNPTPEILADVLAILDFESRAEAEEFIEFLLETDQLSRSEADGLLAALDARFPRTEAA